MPSKPKDINRTPPGLWRYVHPETGYRFHGAHGFARIYAMVIEYTNANKTAPILRLDEKIVDYMCEQEPDWCDDYEPPSLARRAFMFGQAAVNWAIAGFGIVDHAVFEERKAICLACPYWRGEAALGYGACAKCGCSGLKLFVPSQSCPDGRWPSI